MPLPDPSIGEKDNMTDSTNPVTPIKTIDANTVVEIMASIRANIPLLQFAYVAWLGYGEPIDSVVVQERMAIIKPIIEKAPADVTDIEAATLVGALARIAVEGGKELSSKLLPLFGRDLVAILSALGLLV